MNFRRTTSGLLLVIVLAFTGLLLVVLPPKLLDHYERMRELNATWATIYLAVVSAGAVMLAVSGLAIVIRLGLRSRRKRIRRQQQNQRIQDLSTAQKQQEIDANLAAVADLQDEPTLDSSVRAELEPLIREIESKRRWQTLEIVAFGTVSSGKSSLLNALAGRDVFATDARGGTTLRRNEIPWPGLDQVLLVDTPGLGEVEGSEHAKVSADAARDADLVLLVVDGPLRNTEHRLLEHLTNMEKRVVLCLNKEDWYDAGERQALLGQLTRQVQGMIAPQDVVAVRSRPTERRRVRVSASGDEVEERVAVPADIEALAGRMLQAIRQDGTDLLLANLLLQSRGMVEQARERVQRTLDRRAGEIVDRYMWGAGGAAALSPLPLLDLAAGGAVSVKMVVELAKVYRQDIDLHVAVNLLGQLGKNLLGILGVHAATPAVTAAVASLLKTIPGAGTLAGGILQGLVQALITRWIGAVFIEYFKNEMRQPEGGMSSLARRKWQQVTAPAELRKLLRAARQQLGSGSRHGEDAGDE